MAEKLAEIPKADPATSIARLHGEACYWCGAALVQLHPAGSVRTETQGGWRVWSIVACDAHRSRRAS